MRSVIVPPFGMEEGVGLREQLEDRSVLGGAYGTLFFLRVESHRLTRPDKPGDHGLESNIRKTIRKIAYSRYGEKVVSASWDKTVHNHMECGDGGARADSCRPYMHRDISVVLARWREGRELLRERRGQECPGMAYWHSPAGRNDSEPTLPSA